MELTPIQKDIIYGKICPYCKSKTKQVTELEVYGKEYKGRILIACINFPNCDSYVGTHSDDTSLGRLANHDLRKAKRNAHYWFDKIWKEKYKKRSELYTELSEFLDLDKEFTHIGMFQIKTCNKVSEWAKLKYNNFKNL